MLWHGWIFETTVTRKWCIISADTEEEAMSKMSLGKAMLESLKR